MLFIFLILGAVSIVLSIYIFIKTAQLNNKGKKIQVKIIKQEPITKKIKHPIEDDQNIIYIGYTTLVEFNNNGETKRQTVKIKHGYKDGSILNATILNNNVYVDNEGFYNGNYSNGIVFLIVGTIFILFPLMYHSYISAEQSATIIAITIVISILLAIIMRKQDNKTNNSRVNFYSDNKENPGMVNPTLTRQSSVDKKNKQED